MSTITSTFNYCTPTSASASATYTTTVYEVILPACDGYKIWDATYTITDYCEDECHGYQAGYIPPGFQVSTVHCPVCPTPEVVITCPTVVPAKPTGVVPPPYVHGNGVTVVEECHECQETGSPSPYTNKGTPTITIYDQCTENCAPPPTNSPGPVYPPPPPAPPASSGKPAPPANSNYPPAPGPPAPPANSNYPPAPPVTNQGYPVPPSSNGPVVPPVSTKPSSPYQTAPPPVVVAGAPSVSRSLGLISGLAAIAGYIYLL